MESLKTRSALRLEKETGWAFHQAHPWN